MIDGKVVLGITQGDVNGIGYEVMLRALADAAFSEMFVPVIYGSSQAVGHYRKVLGLGGPQVNVVRDAQEVHPRRINLVECGARDLTVEMGQPTRAGGDAARDALERFFLDQRCEVLDGLVTLPVNKHAMQGSGFNFPGHTEYLAKCTGVQDALMLMVAEDLRLGVVTGHVPLRGVAELITPELILRKLELMDASLQRDFAISGPRMAVLSLNPHAGENGLLGDEEELVIKPAIEAANTAGMVVAGPFAADGFFGAGEWRHYDGVLAMYHDQGLTPFKTIAFDGGVNYTAGLPIVRTSPAHGTAYSLVGKGIASPNSFRQAVYLAIDIVKSRSRIDPLRANPVPSWRAEQQAKMREG